MQIKLANLFAAVLAVHASQSAFGIFSGVAHYLGHLQTAYLRPYFDTLYNLGQNCPTYFPQPTFKDVSKRPSPNDRQEEAMRVRQYLMHLQDSIINNGQLDSLRDGVEYLMNTRVAADSADSDSTGSQHTDSQSDKEHV
ncbi:hypothetical protein PAPHI01_0692 [Pancytospora philotis]|nr:hypothetical protein PAPHI01_0692 [Pancytospora philotis]